MNGYTMQQRESTASSTAVFPATYRRALGALAFAGLTAIGARLSVPLPGGFVPLTLQPVAVLLAGVMLGSRGGAASQMVYLAAGVSGLPVFAAGGGLLYLLGPTGGYLLAFPVAAWLAGRVCRPQAGWGRWAAGLTLALCLIHLGGLGWLAVVAGTEVARTVGVAPFLAGDVLKILLVLLVGRGTFRLARRPSL